MKYARAEWWGVGWLMRVRRIIVAVGATSAVAGLAAAGVLAMGGDRLPWPWRSSSADEWQVLERYCVSCHNDIDRSGDLSFEKIERDDFHGNAAIWEAAVRKVRSGFMPPVDAPRPERHVLDG